MTINRIKLALATLINACFIFSSSYLYAHELSPNVVDIKVVKNRVEIKFVTNLEAYITGVDFSMMGNAEDHDNFEYYKKLRNLKQTELSAVFLKNWDEFTSLFTLSTKDGGELDDFSFSSIELEEIDNLDVSRLGTVYFFVETAEMRPFTFKA